MGCERGRVHRDVWDVRGGGVCTGITSRWITPTHPPIPVGLGSSVESLTYYGLLTTMATRA